MARLRVPVAFPKKDHLTAHDQLQLLQTVSTSKSKLTSQQIEFFKSEGYLYPFRAVEREEAREFRLNIEKYKQNPEPRTQKALKLKSYLSIMRLYNHVRNPAILDVVESLLGPNLLCIGAALFVKDAQDNRFVSWHGDSAYFGLDPTEAVTTWTGFTESNIENGCLQVIPKSHLESADKHQHVETYDQNNLLSRGQTIQNVDESKAVFLKMGAGEFEVHHIRLVHGSKGNLSNDRRIGFNTVYIPTHVRSTIGRRSALLVRGVDDHHHWDADPIPKHDFDPVPVEHAVRSFDDYVRSEEHTSAL